jgi:hypothetical protein
MRTAGLICVALVLLVQRPTLGDEKLFGIACRSVHLGYPAPNGTAFTLTARVTHSAPGTYVMVCGWRDGYFGMQELANGKKLLLFSVWDSEQNNPDAVAAEKRVQTLYHDPQVRLGRFGGEGSGGQSFFDYDWKIDEDYRFLVEARPNGDRTEFTGWFFVPEDRAWKKLVTFSTITQGRSLSGYYSFVEDFRRNRESTKHERAAAFRDGWVRSSSGEWKPLTQARFTGDANPAMNINAYREGAWFHLGTGGMIENTGAKLREVLELPKEDRRPPTELPAMAEA